MELLLSILLCILCCCVNIIVAQPCNSNNNVTDSDLPLNWPCHWSDDGVIPFVFNFYSMNLKRLKSVVRKGHRFIEQRSCLRFEESDPREMARKHDFTYLYYSYSGVLENCCFEFFSRPVGRRLVLITPLCLLPVEVAHATLHGLGLFHEKHLPFHEEHARAVMFAYKCQNYDYKRYMFNSLL